MTQSGGETVGATSDPRPPELTGDAAVGATDGAFGPPPPAENATDRSGLSNGWEGSDIALRGAIEAIVLVVDEPVSAITLAQVLEQPTDRVTDVLTELAADYDSAQRGFELRQVAGGWRLYTRADYADLVERFVLDGQQARLTQAALETLAVVAYRQPVSRARISAVRGVNVDGVVRTLVARGLIEEHGTEPEHGAVLYRTTAVFLERLGIGSLEDLPDLAPLVPDISTVDDFDVSPSH